MEKDNSIIRMEVCIMENGKKTRCTVEVFCITLVVNQPMTENGKMICSRVEESSIMNIRYIYRVLLIIVISMPWMIIGLDTMENCRCFWWFFIQCYARFTSNF